MIRHFENHLSKCYKFFFYSYPHLAIIAHFLVFQYDKGMHLDSEENIANHLQHAYKMGPHIQHNFGGLKTLSFIYIENLFSTLNSMARFFAQHVVWKDFEHPSDNSSNMPHSPSSSDGGSPTSTDLVPRYFKKLVIFLFLKTLCFFDKFQILIFCLAALDIHFICILWVAAKLNHNIFSLEI